MADRETLKQIIELQQTNYLTEMLYKDKQLLKEEDYLGFAKHRYKEVRRSFIGGLCFFALLIVTSVSYFLQYQHAAETGSGAVQLAICLLTLIGGICILFYSTREYYSTKTSMTLVLKLLEEDQQEFGEKVTENVLETIQ